MPTENPRLSNTFYEIALVAPTTNPSYHEILLKIIKCWPRTLYSALPVISATETQIYTSSMIDMLKETLAELYIIDNQYEKALVLFAELMKPEIFDFIEKHYLHEAIHDKMTTDKAEENEEFKKPIFRDISRYYCNFYGICRSKKSLIRSHVLSHHKDGMADPEAVKFDSEQDVGKRGETLAQNVAPLLKNHLN